MTHISNIITEMGCFYLDKPPENILPVGSDHISGQLALMVQPTNQSKAFQFVCFVEEHEYKMWHLNK